MDSRELVRRVARAAPGDPLWDDFVKLCRAIVRTTLRRWRAELELRPDPRDIEQEVLRRLVAGDRAHLRRFDGKRRVSFTWYLRRVAETVVMDWVRHEYGRRGEAPLVFSQGDAGFLDRNAEHLYGSALRRPDDDVRMREVEEVVHEFLEATVPDPLDRALCRRIFRLRFHEGYTIQQIMRMRAVPLSASSISRRMHAMREHLRKVFGSRASPRDRSRDP